MARTPNPETAAAQAQADEREFESRYDKTSNDNGDRQLPEEWPNSHPKIPLVIVTTCGETSSGSELDVDDELKGDCSTFIEDTRLFDYKTEHESSDEKIGTMRSPKDRKDGKTSTLVERNPFIDHDQATERTKSRLNRVDELKAKAFAFSDMGCNEEALQVYRKILCTNAAETARIKSLLKQVERKHPSKVGVDHLRLVEDIHMIQLSDAQIHMKMALLHEQLGLYQCAIKSCNKARETFKNHQDLGRLSYGGKSMNDWIQGVDAMEQKIRVAQSFQEECRQEQNYLFHLRNSVVATGDKKLLAEEEKSVGDLMNSDILGISEEPTQSADTPVGQNNVASECHPEEPTQKELLHVEVTSDKKLLVEANESVVDTINKGTRGSSEGQTMVAETHIATQGKVASRSSKPDLGFLMEALEISKRALGNEQIGNCLVEIAQWYTHNSKTKDDDAVAIGYYEQALEIFCELPQTQARMGSIWNEIANVHMRNEELDKAIGSLSQALDYFDGRDTENTDFDATCERILVLRNLGFCYFQKNEYDKSANYLYDTLDMQRNACRLYDKLEDVPECDLVTGHGIADTLRQLAKVYQRAGEPEKGYALLKKAVSIYRIEVDQTALNDEDLSKAKDELARTLYKFARVCLIRAEYDQALTSFRESIELWSNPGQKTQRAMCLLGMGNVYMAKEQLDVALETFVHALYFCNANGIHEDNEIRQKIQYKITKIKEAKLILRIKELDGRVESNLEQGDLIPVVQSLNEIVEMQEELLKINESLDLDSNELKRGIGGSLAKLGFVLFSSDDAMLAEQAYCKASQQFQLIGDTTKCQEISLELDKVREGLRVEI